MPERRRHLHWLHHAGISRTNSCLLWTSRPERKVSAGAIGVYGRTIRALRSFTNDTVNKEPKWRHPRAELTTGYSPQTY